MTDDTNAARGRIKAALDYGLGHVQLTETQAREVLAYIAQLEAKVAAAEERGLVFNMLPDGRVDFCAIRERSPLREVGLRGLLGRALAHLAHLRDEHRIEDSATADLVTEMAEALNTTRGDRK